MIPHQSGFLPSPALSTPQSSARNPHCSLSAGLYCTYLARYTGLGLPGCSQLWMANLRNIKWQQKCFEQACVDLPCTQPHHTFPAPHQLLLHDSQPLCSQRHAHPTTWKLLQKAGLCPVPQSHKVPVAGRFSSWATLSNSFKIRWSSPHNGFIEIIVVILQTEYRKIAMKTSYSGFLTFWEDNLNEG